MIRPTKPHSISLQSLAQHFGLDCESDAVITGISADNRNVLPGDLFVGVPGAKLHGARFADRAVEAGAAAVFTDPHGATLVTADVPVLVMENLANWVGEAADVVTGHPSSKLTSFGITGTNGKTTTAFMIDSILRAIGETTGLIGTVALRIAEEDVPAELTTPQPADLHTMLAKLVERGGTSLVMEVSSHALEQGRTEPIRFSVAGFTNLTQDHLDYHETLEEYFAAKSILFDEAHCERAVITVDDEWGRKLYEQTSTRPGVVPLAMYGELPATHSRGWRVSDIAVEADGSKFTLIGTDGTTIVTRTTLPGDFNIANAALAAVMLIESGLPIDKLTPALEDGITPQVPGRMEIVGDTPRVVVDFAHNTDALEKAIEALRPTTSGRLVVITGSAGDRDRLKRPMMARVVAQHADQLVVTDDDPHSEDPVSIRKELIAGIPEGFDWIEIGDRETAIRETILRAEPADTILVAGRGHETIQEVAGDLVEIDDRVIAREALAQRHDERTAS